MSRVGAIGVAVFWSVVAFWVATALWAPWLGVLAGIGFTAIVVTVLVYRVVTAIESMVAEDRLSSGEGAMSRSEYAGAVPALQATPQPTTANHGEVSHSPAALQATGEPSDDKAARNVRAGATGEGETDAHEEN